MGNMFGSSGYTPGEGGGMTGDQGNFLSQLLMGNTSTSKRGTDDEGFQNWKNKTGGANFMGNDISDKKWAGMSPQEKEQFMTTTTPNTRPDQQEGFYKPGSSGYDFGSKYQATDFKNEAEPYYSGILGQTNEATKAGMQSGLDATQGMMGSRGLGRSGIANQGLGNVVDSSSRQMASNAQNVGFQRAQDYNTLNQASDKSRQAAEQYRQAGMGAQAATDSAMRGEKMTNYNTPIQQLMAMYGQNMGASGNQASQGWVGSALGGIGSGIQGIASF